MNLFYRSISEVLLTFLKTFVFFTVYGTLGINYEAIAFKVMSYMDNAEFIEKN